MTLPHRRVCERKLKRSLKRKFKRKTARHAHIEPRLVYTPIPKTEQIRDVRKKGGLIKGLFKKLFNRKVI